MGETHEKIYIRRHNVPPDVLKLVKKRLLVLQDEKCAICRLPFTKERKCYLDHDPVSGCTRGLLCLRCNMLIGAFHHDCNFLRKALSYLETSTENIEKLRYSAGEMLRAGEAAK